ncbi:MAG: sulfite exporter TauE/SafE family protein [Clostridia bacterium]|nr:sulfite exporter TauE/SafE family protein [Clostridia bacterium]
MKTLLIYITIGFSAGIVNGLFGTGAGIVFVFFFASLAFSADRTFATTNITVLFISLVSLFIYLKNRTLTPEVLPYFFESAFLPALTGGAVGSILLSKLKGGFLNKLFSLLVIAGAIGRLIR